MPVMVAVLIIIFFNTRLHANDPQYRMPFPENVASYSYVCLNTHTRARTDLCVAKGDGRTAMRNLRRVIWCVG